MADNIIDARLKIYAPKTVEDEEHALKEILQEIAIYGLANTDFFNKAIFHGGTALRILYGLPRFSEDLDFLLKKPDPHFKWEVYQDEVIATCKQFGVKPEVTDKSRVEKTVKKMFLKDDSIGKILDLTFVHHARKKLSIKFEIDTNPPQGSQTELKFLEFPLDYSLLAQDLSSNFAGKCHALLCREYIKGRDWYDFSWYVSKRITPNFIFLKHALYQQGPWANQKISLTPDWFVNAMQQKIKNINWHAAVRDVEPFLNSQDKRTLQLWGIDFFIEKLRKLAEIIKK
jgi:predicted nucleotidyltransferase component of viral defense system